ncbi:MAG: Rid family detoxifying hydrolase [Methanomassiliicoccaceae archaeon]|nr:Rid family detoxifying hydrolase [Methanomassiliicoccaceae archaeon]
MKPVRTDKAPLPAGPYSQAVITGNLVFVSGLIPTSPSDGKIPEGTEEQIRLTLKNVVSVLEAAGVGKGKVIKVSVYLTDMNDFSLMNSIYEKTFSSPYPARTCIGVTSLPKGVKIMIDAVGEIGQ